MSDSDEYEDYGQFGDYYYLEDEYGPADDLAEHACPSPILYDGDDEWDEHSRFTDYWADLAYNSDSYFSDRDEDSRLKRKRGVDEADGKKTDTKKRKYHIRSRPTSPVGAQDILPPVMWMSQSERPTGKGKIVRKLPAPALVVSDSKKLQTMKTAFGQTQTKTRLVKVKDAPEEEDMEEQEDVGAEDEGDWKDEDEAEAANGMEGDGDADADDADDGPQIDPEMLKMVLRQHLLAAGIDVNAVDMCTLMEFADKMLSGDADSEDIAGQLTDNLLGGQDQDGTQSEDDPEDTDKVSDEDDEAAARKPKSSLAKWALAQADASTKEKAGKRKEKANTTGAAEPWPPPAEKNGVNEAQTIRRNGKRKADDDINSNNLNEDATVDASDLPSPKKRATRLHRVFSVDLVDKN